MEVKKDFQTVVPRPLFLALTLTALLLLTTACEFSLAENTGFVLPQSESLTAEAAMDQFVKTEDARCAELTVEECSNLGTNWYEEDWATSDEVCSNVNYEPYSRSHTVTFEPESNKVVLEYFRSIDGYAGHLRTSTNTYKFTHPVGYPVYTVTFLPNGFTEQNIMADYGCIWTYTNTLSSP
jgi:hypothetical protein